MPPSHLFCPAISQDGVVLSPDESHHAIASLRLKPGDDVTLFDGAGTQAVGTVSRIQDRRLHVDVTRITRHPFELSRKLTLAVAMPKTHRQGYVIEKCTELGVAAIWPIMTRRGVARPSAAAIEKWSRRAVEAAKQSYRTWVPFVEPLQSLDESLARIGEFDAAAFADFHGAETSLAALVADLPEPSTLAVWVGPEGGWTDAERSRAIGAGAVPTALGPTVLRTETAALTVCAAVALCSPAPAQSR